MTSRVLGANVAFGVPYTCVASEAPSKGPPVKQKSSSKIVSLDIKPREEGAFGGCWVNFKKC